jgi:hypothetical protein
MVTAVLFSSFDNLISTFLTINEQYLPVGEPVNEKSSFWICGRKLELPPTPDPIDVLLKKKVKRGSKKGKKTKKQGPVSPNKKRYRLKRKQK